MASTNAKAIRRADALGRLSRALDIEQAELQFHGRGDPELALVVTLERVADAVEGLVKAAAAIEPDSKGKAKK